MRRIVHVFSLAILLVTAWQVLGNCCPQTSERFYLLVPPVALLLSLGRTPHSWRTIAAQVGPYVLVMTAFVLTYNLYLSRLVFPHDERGLLSSLSLGEVAVAVYFLGSLRILLSVPLHWLRHPVRRSIAWVLRVPAEASAATPRWKSLAHRVLPEMLLVPLILPYVMGAMFVHRFKVPNNTTPASVGRAYEEISFPTEDGLTLRGWFIAAADTTSPRTLIVCHGLGANRSTLLPYLLVANDLAANVLLFDFRGHGDSDGHTISLGLDEERDVRAAIAYLRTERPPQARELIGLGVSMGSSALIHAAATVSPPLDAVVTDSGFAAAAELTDKALAHFPPALRPWLGQFGLLVASAETGRWLDTARPTDHVHKLRCPLLIVHADRDELVPPEHAHRLYAHAAAPKALWIADTDGHGSALSATTQYLEQVRLVLVTSRRPGGETAFVRP